MPRTKAPTEIYLDNAATSFPKPEPVYRAVEACLRSTMGNPWQAQYPLSAEAERAVEGARGLLNDVYRGDGPERWVHTFNGTDGLSMAIKGVLKPGDHVVTTDLEHDSVYRPLNALEEAGVITQTRVASDGGYVDPDAIRRAITPKTALVAVTHASNLAGTVQPIEAIAPIVREADALFLIDAAQSVGQVEIDLRKTPIDLMAFSGHKSLFGPTGTGGLYVGPRAEPRPWREGDTGGGSPKDLIHPLEWPSRLEGGTPNTLGVVGMAAGVAWVRERGAESIRRQLVDLLRPVVEWAERAEGWRVAGRWEPDRHIGVLSLIPPEGQDPKKTSKKLVDRYGIAVRSGLQEAVYLNKALGSYPNGTLRICPGPFNTADDIDRLIEGLDAVALGKK
jgi:cysteine desulfurase/selenocysteine lyase